MTGMDGAGRADGGGFQFNFGVGDGGAPIDQAVTDNVVATILALLGDSGDDAYGVGSNDEAGDLGVPAPDNFSIKVFMTSIAALNAVVSGDRTEFSAEMVQHCTEKHKGAADKIIKAIEDAVKAADEAKKKAEQQAWIMGACAAAMFLAGCIVAVACPAVGIAMCVGAVIMGASVAMTQTDAMQKMMDGFADMLQTIHPEMSDEEAAKRATIFATVVVVTLAVAAAVAGTVGGGPGMGLMFASMIISSLGPQIFTAENLEKCGMESDKARDWALGISIGFAALGLVGGIAGGAGMAKASIDITRAAVMIMAINAFVQAGGQGVNGYLSIEIGQDTKDQMYAEATKVLAQLDEEMALSFQQYWEDNAKDGGDFWSTVLGYIVEVISNDSETTNTALEA